jgi:hypothetical protein
LLLFFVARWAWHDTMDMVEFMVQLPEQRQPSAALQGEIASARDNV